MPYADHEGPNLCTDKTTARAASDTIQHVRHFCHRHVLCTKVNRVRPLLAKFFVREFLLHPWIETEYSIVPSNMGVAIMGKLCSLRGH